MKILIIEDSEMIREGLVEILNTNNKLVISQADNGINAIKMFEEQDPDVVVVDLGLPYMSGIEVLRKIKTTKPSVKAAVLTNHIESYFKDICIKHGADFFFDKSSQLDDFTQAINVLAKEHAA